VNFVPSSSNIVHYAQVVQKKSTLRENIQSASEIVGGLQGRKTWKNFWTALNKLCRFQKNSSNKISCRSNRFLNNRIDELHKGDHQLRGVPSGYRISTTSWPVSNPTWSFGS
jgi:replicative DNA helicase